MIKKFAEAFVDDMAVYSMSFEEHLKHLERFLQTIRPESGLTLKLKECRFAQPEVKFCGQLAGSGTRHGDPNKIAAISNLKVPETK